jgi:AAA15 family ATPase/GTPase
MITELRMSNFFSISEPLVISFESGVENRFGYYKYFETKTVKRSTSLINGFFGTNASGKTNILKALSSILFYSSTINPAAYTGVVPNFQNKNIDKPTKLGANFLFGNKVYEYDLEFKNNSIVNELFKVKILKGTKPQSKLVFERKLNSKIKFGPDFTVLRTVLPNIEYSPIQSILPFFKIARSPDLTDFWSGSNNYFGNVRWVNELDSKMGEIINAFIPAYRKDNSILDTIINIIKLFDPTIEDVIIKDESDKVNIRVKHYGFAVPIDIVMESSGTIELFGSGYQIINCLKNGGVLVFDEVNRYLHPEIQNEIYNLFLNPSINTKNAQIFFSSHDHEVMNSLLPGQINLVEKAENSTVSYKLSDVDGVTGRDNFQKKYRFGVYGATPDPSEFNYKMGELV